MLSMLKALFVHLVIHRTFFVLSTSYILVNKQLQAIHQYDAYIITFYFGVEHKTCEPGDVLVIGVFFS